MQKEFCQQFKIQEITEKKIWEDFLKDVEEKTFLQSWAWGEFQKKTAGKIWRLGIYQQATPKESDETSDPTGQAGDGRKMLPPKQNKFATGQAVAGCQLVGAALVVLVKAKRGSFLLVPHGPLLCSRNPKFQIPNPKQISNPKSQILKTLLNKLKEIAGEEKVSFIRVNSTWERTEENIQIFKDLGFRNAPIHIHPEATWQLDIAPPEDELLKNMRKTTRYLIKKARRDKDIEITQSQNIEDIENFSELHRKVSLRQNFVPFSLEYLKNEFSAFKGDNQISLFIGKYKGKIIASSFFIFYSGKGFYHHAALLKEYSKIPIACLILWEAIREAKKRGFSFFDFWGYVSPKENPSHPWAGPTLFKMGFGGEKREYVKTQDFLISKKYWLTFAFEEIRKKKRSL